MTHGYHLKIQNSMIIVKCGEKIQSFATKTLVNAIFRDSNDKRLFSFKWEIQKEEEEEEDNAEDREDLEMERKIKRGDEEGATRNYTQKKARSE
ncbi:hypothetical protein PoB_007092500 [Plakobranchus ocellatus]|uniref:Uncharacterized protein n=1 Tax=Plakobranchus ocellatus TaxID=259542 RepID=A0AAV4DKB2_9GAST|nr:hypothetical protein PoB_007092500 [Plakobranchus ocellatus]